MELIESPLPEATRNLKEEPVMRVVSNTAVNHWPDNACARAFWSQHELPAYQALLADTLAWTDPQLGQRWLDLGCGCGQLAQALWHKSEGNLAEVVGLDCAAINARAFAAWCRTVEPSPRPGQVRFILADFSAGLGDFPNNHFDGIVSGLAIQYAESYSQELGTWTTEAYDRLLLEVHRVLCPGGSFIFSVNVPNPSWSRVGLASLPAFWKVGRRARFLGRAVRMWRYGLWLKREARKGRFHYLPLDAVLARLAFAGFVHVEHRLCYAEQAYLIRAVGGEG
jgi:SAM-dependent methyltransferase